MTYTEHIRHDPPRGRSADQDRGAWADSSTAIDPVTGRVLPVDTDASPRTSLLAVLGMAAGLLGLSATVTGLLAPEGLLVAAVGVLFCLGGLIRAGRADRTGRGIAASGGLIAVIAAALAALAMTGRYSWLNSGTDHVADAHRWLVDHWSWLDRWS